MSLPHFTFLMSRKLYKHAISPCPTVFQLLKIAVLGSTRGTDLQAIIDAINGHRLKAEIVAVISNKKDAYILERAKKYRLPAFFLDPKGKSKEDYDHEILSVLEEKGADLIMLIGYMKIVTKVLIDIYPDKIINVHPSLLPKYGGGMDKDVHKAVLKAKEKVTGCTVHIVTEEVDKGPILLQRQVPVLSSDTAETLKIRVQQAEQTCLVKVLQLYAGNRIRIENNKAIVLPEN